MGLLDWLRGETPAEDVEAGLSRRDFFAKVAGRGAESAAPAEAPRNPEGPQVIRTFYVGGFPYYDGPVLVPHLRQDMELSLRVDPYHPTDPHYVWIEWGRDQLGYVPPEHSEHIRLLLNEGAKLRCRASRVNPTASLVEVLQVEVSLLPPASEESVPGSAEAG
jgi:hypothetical protein